MVIFKDIFHHLITIFFYKVSARLNFHSVCLPLKKAKIPKKQTHDL